MDNIISDCGLATYGCGYWKKLSPEAWEEIHAAAERSGYRHILRYLHMCTMDEKLPMYRVASYIRAKYREVYDWFRDEETPKVFPSCPALKRGADHTRDYLGTVCRDILGIVELYLRCRRVSKNKTETFMMGSLQSFDDQPAYVRVDGTEGVYSWNNRNGLHRDNGQPAYIHVVDSMSEFVWYVDDKRTEILPDITGISLYTHDCTLAVDYCWEHLTEKTEADTADLRRMLRWRYGAYLH